MPLIRCKKCGKYFDEKAPACLLCGVPVHYVDPPPPIAAEAAEESSGRMVILKWVLIAMVPVLIYQCSTSSDKQNRASGNADRPAEAFSSLDALLLCQTALKRVSRDPEKASIPYVEDFGRGDESYFAWGPQTKMARMRNGLGLEVAATASCSVNRTTKQITTLTLEGKTIL